MMKQIIMIISLVACLGVTACVSSRVDPFADPDSRANAPLCFGRANHDAVDVSIVNLIATPEKYHGKIVRLLGVVRIEFEGNAIFLSQEHYRHRVRGTSINISPDYNALGTDEKTLTKLNGRYVVLEGTFIKEIASFPPAPGRPLIDKVHRVDIWDH